MTERVLMHFGVGRPQDLVREIYLGAARPTSIAGLAPLVGTAAADGDAVAKHIVTNAAVELAGAAVSVVTRLGIDTAPIVLSGGTLLGLDLLRTGLERELAQQLPRAAVRRLDVDPACGAVRLAIGAGNGTLVLPAYDNGYS
jgi:N-acetylglucosamine kinase-like BadF-type ATPase